MAKVAYRAATILLYKQMGMGVSARDVFRPLSRAIISLVFALSGGLVIRFHRPLSTLELCCYLSAGPSRPLSKLLPAGADVKNSIVNSDKTCSTMVLCALHYNVSTVVLAKFQTVVEYIFNI